MRNGLGVIGLATTTLGAAIGFVASAQQPAAPAAGDSVRITAPSLKLYREQGILLSIGMDSVRMRKRAPDTGIVSIAISQVKRLEVADHKPRRAIGEGALLGGLVGLTAGTIATTTCPGIWNSCHADPAVAFSAGAVGAVLGTGIGAFFWVTNWRDVPLTQDMRVSLSVTPHSLGARLSIKL
jgi:hypothetical protein